MTSIGLKQENCSVSAKTDLYAPLFKMLCGVILSSLELLETTIFTKKIAFILHEMTKTYWKIQPKCLGFRHTTGTYSSPWAKLGGFRLSDPLCHPDYGLAPLKSQRMRHQQSFLDTVFSPTVSHPTPITKQISSHFIYFVKPPTPPLATMNYRTDMEDVTKYNCICKH